MSTFHLLALWKLGCRVENIFEEERSALGRVKDGTNSDPDGQIIELVCIPSEASEARRKSNISCQSYYRLFKTDGSYRCLKLSVLLLCSRIAVSGHIALLNRQM